MTAALRITATRLNWQVFSPRTHPLTPVQEALGRRLPQWAKLPLDESSRIELELPSVRSRVYHIGRLKIADLYLPSFRVRRRHAELELMHPAQWVFRSEVEEVWDLTGSPVGRKTLFGKSRMLLGDYAVELLRARLVDAAIVLLCPLPRPRSAPASARLASPELHHQTQGGAMRASRALLCTLRADPAAGSRGAALLLRAGFIHQLSAGIYSYGPLMRRALRRIEAIIHEEHERVGRKRS